MQVKIRCRSATAHTDPPILIVVGCSGGTVPGLGIRGTTAVVLADVLGKVVRVDQVGGRGRGQVVCMLALIGGLVVVLVGGAWGSRLAFVGGFVQKLGWPALGVVHACLLLGRVVLVIGAAA